MPFLLILESILVAILDFETAIHQNGYKEVASVQELRVQS